ncbi:DNA topoisomerase 1 [bacterium BMS3Bbin06]|nr:DNA topoisomerase 1 [bacterium BMS3Bbin06]HDO35509.1 type I DNA topoisomerase [Nitrospirota bacterium]
MKSLVIVESPAKAKTINKILGKGYTVKASVGHVRDLPKKELGVDVENDFLPKYAPIPGKDKVIKELRKAARDSGAVYLAPDPDREGEAIAWHIHEELKKISKGKGSKGIPEIYRVTFNEITGKAVSEAMKNPGIIDMNKVDAQQARRVLDRLVGYGLSPLLWRKVRRGLSAGRVQSVAVRLVVEREREIEAFESVEYWSIKGFFEGKVPPSFHARLFKYKDQHVINREKKEFLLKDGKSADAVLRELRKREFLLKGVEKKERKRNPSPPFITSTLQQEASRKLRFSPKKTMVIAQQLYEGVELGEEGSAGLITYMRTDSVRVSDEAREGATEYIHGQYGEEYVRKGKIGRKKAKGKIQDAHEAIRPTYLDKPPQRIKGFLSRDQHALYRLIWQRFIASQMAPAKIEQTTFIIVDREEDAEFRVSGDVIKFGGFIRVYTESTEENGKEEEETLPPLSMGEKLLLKDIEANQHFTQPPPRYTEASLVKALEEKGIGRPSTYAAILSTIQERKYAMKEDGKLRPTELGSLVNDLLVERFPELMDIGFTAKLEDELDRIELGKLKWVKVVKQFYTPFNKELTEAMDTLGRVKPQDEPTDQVCELCGQPMVKRWGRHGRFLACTGFPECKNAKPIEDDDAAVKPPPAKTDIRCPECSAEMVVKQGRFGRFLACSKYPDCKGTSPISTGVKCPLDGGDIVEKRSKKGRIFYSCSNWPDCKFATWYKPVPQKCPECSSEYLLEKRDRAGKTTVFCPDKNCKYKKVEEEKNLVTDN